MQLLHCNVILHRNLAHCEIISRPMKNIAARLSFERVICIRLKLHLNYYIQIRYNAVYNIAQTDQKSTSLHFCVVFARTLIR